MKGGVDQGSCCCSYRRLSYRRKFIRTLWLIPIFAAISAPLFAFDIPPGAGDHVLRTVARAGIVIGAMIAFPIQAVYTYRKWQREQTSDGGV